MGIEFSIIKDMATISATASELAGIQQLILTEIESEAFLNDFDDLLIDIVNTYRIFNTGLEPLIAIQSAERFYPDFKQTHTAFNEGYQNILSQPRINAEFTYEKYLQFRQRKELKTSYPPLKKAFARLHDLIDKWIDNDIWLAMTIDTQLKMLVRFLNEVDQLFKQDKEASFAYYSSCIGYLSAYKAIIESALVSIECNMNRKLGTNNAVENTLQAAGE